MGVRAVATGSVTEALELALAEAGEDDLVLVTGSLYTVGAARTALVGEPGLEAGHRLN
jgi:dihydrofolate synthase/folylpolyglutamate synthase